MENFEGKRTLNHIYNEDYDKYLRVSEAKDCHIKVNGKWLIDTSMGCGTHLLGHNFSKDVVKKAISKGSLYASPYYLADKCGDLLYEATGFDKFVFCNSGSEATLRAIRIARAYTGRDKIALFQGCWHGTHDWNLALYSKGIPQSVKDLVIVLPFTDKAFDIIQQERPALVMVEPIQGALPIDRKKFLTNLKVVTNRCGSVLCFDEVISGFRSELGGASELFGITPDLVTYGKTIGGGFPVGVVGGNGVMDVTKTGVRMGGTFSANPITINACIGVLEYLLKNKNLYNTLQKIEPFHTNRLQVISCGNIYRLLFTNQICNDISTRDEFESDRELQQIIVNNLRNSGVFINSNRLILFSTLHKDIHINKIVKELNEQRL